MNLVLDPVIKNILIYSAVVVVIIAMIIFIFIGYKIYKIKKTIKKQNLEIYSQESVIEGHNRVIERTDLGEPIFEVRDAVAKPLDDEIVEFVINTIIKNKFQNILMLGHKTPYEIIAISNKANVTINMLSSEFNGEEYNKINETIIFENSINVLECVDNNIEYDLILLLSSKEPYLPIYEKYISNLRDSGMFLIAKTDKNRLWKKEIIKKINKNNMKYDILKWYKGFILIVK